MLKAAKDDFHILKVALKSFLRFPVFGMPLLFVWCIYISMFIYFKWHFDWYHLNKTESILILFSIVYVFSLLLSLSCSILLELIQQKETGKSLNIFKSLWDTLTKNIAQILVVSFVWAFIYFILSLLQALVNRKKETSEDDDESMENVALALSGHAHYSGESITIKTLKKGIRMVVFLIMPAIAWENMNLRTSVKRGTYILKHRIGDFISFYTLSYLITFIVFIPPMVLAWMKRNLEMDFPAEIWFMSIVYIAFAWSFSVYIEQMLMAELYLWHLKWEREVRCAEEHGTNVPAFEEVEIPSVLDNKMDLL